MVYHWCLSWLLSGPIDRAEPLKTRAPVAIGEIKPRLLANAAQAAIRRNLIWTKVV